MAAGGCAPDTHDSVMPHADVPVFRRAFPKPLVLALAAALIAVRSETRA
jgi:hypothetical protein